MSGSAANPARVVLVGQGAFRHLKALQDVAPGPRLEMRYWIEGMAAVLQQDAPLARQWLGQAREAVFAHLQAQLGAPVQGHRQEQGQARGLSQDTGTGGRQTVEGAASARTVEAPARPQSARHGDCKALQISEATFQWLKGVQGTTRDPRIEIRYLVEGAVTLLTQQAAVPDAVVRHARRALQAHLAALDHLSAHNPPLE